VESIQQVHATKLTAVAATWYVVYIFNRHAVIWSTNRDVCTTEL